MIQNQEAGVGFSIDLSTLGVSKDGSNDVEMTDDEEVPSHLNTINSSGGFLVVSPDKLSVQYTSVHLHGHDVGVVQANCPAPCRRLVYYFEIFVKNAGIKGQIGIGFTCENFKMRRQPGYDCSSPYTQPAYLLGEYTATSSESKLWGDVEASKWQGKHCGSREGPPVVQVSVESSSTSHEKKGTKRKGDLYVYSLAKSAHSIHPDASGL